jgi:UDP-glucuronate 4-epimerase
MNGKILITGSAGFIGFHLAKRLLEAGHCIVGYDNVNDYYDPSLKESRLKLLGALGLFEFIRADLVEYNCLNKLFEQHYFTSVIHLAAQAGVRYSLDNPKKYIDSNIIGFLNILECCRHHQVRHLLYASSSSVYGLNIKLPFSEDDLVDHPASLYAATKKSNELMAHTYSHLFGIPTTGLRFFTVYGPWGRPDMALFKFTKSILEGKKIDVYNNGEMQRDFTYIDDIIEGIVGLIEKVPVNDPTNDFSRPSSSQCPYSIYNIGNSSPVRLMDMIKKIETILGMKATLNFLPMQLGDVLATYANIDKLQTLTDFVPRTDFDTGLRHFIDWFRSYYKI